MILIGSAVYPSYQVFLASGVAALLTGILMPPFIRLMKHEGLGQQVRADGPKRHLIKQGTPTMGGIIILAGIIITTILMAPGSPKLALAIFGMIATGALGLLDDIESVAHKRSLGLTPSQKMIGLTIICAIFGIVAVNVYGIAPTIEIPFVYTFDLGVLTTHFGSVEVPWLYILFVDILLMGMCNAVNLTDGLDGLAAGTVMIVMIVMAAIAYRSDMLDSAIFAAALAGACVGFLWFNSFPADIFMGDTGSLALGMALGCLAVFTKSEFIVLVIGGLFVAEALSVMIQVFYYKKTHKRIFLMAPLHHHFEKKGWSETKVVVRFWIVSGVLAALGFAVYFAETLMAVA